jgi:hypothetical protein
MSDSNGLVILYHPQCKASQKLISKIPDNFDMIKLVNITTIKSIPSGVRSVPTGIIQGKPISGKTLFDKIDGMVKGPTGIDIFGASNKAGFISNDLSFNLSSNFSTLDENNSQSDGFTGVPKFNESQVRSLEQLQTERM